MGLDYSFNVITKKENKQKVFEFVNQHGSMGEDIHFGYSAAIEFKLDPEIIKYLNNLGNKQHIVESENKGSIGSIYISVKEIDDKHLHIEFTAATTDMSILFSNSSSIKEWFVELGKFANAELVFLDREDSGANLIYAKGKEISLSIFRHIFNNFNTTDFAEIFRLYALATAVWFKKH